jgi:hypothetical protein
VLSPTFAIRVYDTVYNTVLTLPIVRDLNLPEKIEREPIEM